MLPSSHDLRRRAVVEQDIVRHGRQFPSPCCGTARRAAARQSDDPAAGEVPGGMVDVDAMPDEVRQAVESHLRSYERS